MSRLPNGLTSEQDEAFEELARVIADHLLNGGCDGCALHSHPIPSVED